MSTHVNNIISINTDKMLEILFDTSTIVSENTRIIAIQDPPNNSNLHILIARLFPDHNILLSHKKTEKQNDHIILLSKKHIEIIKVHDYKDTQNDNISSKATSLGVSIKIRTNEIDEIREMILFSIYIKPRATYDDTERCLNWIKSTARNNEGNSKTIIVGDFNASNPLWEEFDKIANNKENSEKHYTRIKENRGRTIVSMINEMKLKCLNEIEKVPTFGNSCIDLALVGNKAIRQWNNLKIIKALHNQTRRHFILMITISTSPRQDSTNINKPMKIKYKYIIKKELIHEHMFDAFHKESQTILRDWQRHNRDRQMITLDKISQNIYNIALEIQNKITIKIKNNTRKQINNQNVTNIRLIKLMGKLKRKKKSFKCSPNNKRKTRYRIRSIQNKIISTINTQSKSNYDDDSNL